MLYWWHLILCERLNMNESKLSKMMPFYLSIIGTAATLVMLVSLVNASQWHEVWHTVMLVCILVAGAATGLLLKFRQWSALFLILSGFGAFFSFMLAHASVHTLLGTNYPLVLFAIAPLCISGLWVAVENVTDEEDDDLEAEVQSKPQPEAEEG